MDQSQKTKANIGERIKAQRRANGLTQVALAEKLGVAKRQWLLGKRADFIPIGTEYVLSKRP